MKYITLPYQLNLQFEGIIHPKSIALGDIDDDKLNELVVGTIYGDLHIYKGSQISSQQNELTPWKTCRINGTITSVVIGDIRNIGRSSLLVITAEGNLYLFDTPFINAAEEKPSQNIKCPEFNKVKYGGDTSRWDSISPLKFSPRVSHRVLHSPFSEAVDMGAVQSSMQTSGIGGAQKLINLNSAGHCQGHWAAQSENDFDKQNLPECPEINKLKFSAPLASPAECPEFNSLNSPGPVVSTLPTPSISISSAQRVFSKKNHNIVTPLPSPNIQEHINNSEKIKLIQKPNEQPSYSNVILPNWTSSIPTNTVAAIIEDIDGDGLNELVLGRSDRQIHAYQLTEGRAISNQTLPNTKSKTRGMQVFIGMVRSLDYNSLFWLNKAMFHVKEPISSLKLGFDLKNDPVLIVGQLGGRYLEIDVNGQICLFPKELQGIDAGVPTQLTNVLLPTNSVGVLTATSQGLINSYRLTTGHQIQQILLPSNMPILDIITLPPLQPFTQHPLVACCLTDGTTYFVDHNYQVAKFSFDKSVRGFIGGNFGFEKNSPCLVYVELNGSITLIHHLNVNCSTNLRLPEVTASDLESLLRGGKYRNILEQLNCSSKWPRAKRVALYRHIALYHFQST
ncbi:hypothetical protein CONCODRAFT_165587 [Conidiobolus coronatus NRRL 28638]|uniref:Uncharacterized protein n=1 Tax=Conidiobolus coronatus (strain ATCC 28846 / CBS 209.66 / NRRL 28638) TaxID=796925 RepID=A0A137P3F0_CONC2|nr:hypothetical protein CONCODRAFT_165587 [Conidiobolus coronatus NRRL 28638]|eukprot:KXN69543.1 hypothetical protein CONCODRAFT_165587 [Conidiobolus coronatus NRRL 28638]